MTYQAASGAGARNMRELVAQMRTIGDVDPKLMDLPVSSRLMPKPGILRSDTFPIKEFGHTGSPIPWIDRLMDNGQTCEEWKGMAEANKITGSDEN